MKTAQTAKNLAQHVAKQIAQEPLEVLKTANEQVIGPESPQLPENQSVKSQPQVSQVEQQQKQADKLRSVRHVEALNRELADIQKQDLFKDLQKRIAEGEEVSLESFPELSPEQKDVLRALIEVARDREARQSDKGELAEPATKKGRQLFNFGKKTEMKREQTRVEKPVPPSG